jgi:anti-sigma B factor antagonist
MLGPEDLQDSDAPAGENVFCVEQESIDATTAWDLRPALLNALTEHGPVLWVDLRRVSFIDSTGLGMLVGLLKEARERAGDIRLINAGREIRRILQVTGLEALFEQHTVRM